MGSVEVVVVQDHIDFAPGGGGAKASPIYQHVVPCVLSRNNSVGVHKAGAER